MRLVVDRKCDFEGAESAALALWFCWGLRAWQRCRVCLCAPWWTGGAQCSVSFLLLGELGESRPHSGGGFDQKRNTSKCLQIIYNHSVCIFHLLLSLFLPESSLTSPLTLLMRHCFWPYGTECFFLLHLLFYCPGTPLFYFLFPLWIFF